MMRRLFYISDRNTSGDVKFLLEQASLKFNVHFIILDPEAKTRTDYAKIEFTSNDAVYRASVTNEARALEKKLLNNSTSINLNVLRDSTTRIDGWDEVNHFHENGISVIPSLVMDRTWKKAGTNKDLEINSLGGFPLVVKKMGLSHGRGVGLVNNQTELEKYVSKIKDIDFKKYGLRKYFKSYRHARLILVGGRVVDSIEYIKPEDDFRTNASDEPRVIPMKFESSLSRMSEHAADLRKTSFGGVDILIYKGKGYLAEFNDPCNFARAENVTGVKIAEKIIINLYNL